MIVQAARQHFEAVIAQEKGRLACFQFNIAKGASEHLLSVPEDKEHAITAAGIVDIAMLRRFRKQNADMPEQLKTAIGHTAGGSALNRRRIRIATKSLGATLQVCI